MYTVIMFICSGLLGLSFYWLGYQNGIRVGKKTKKERNKLTRAINESIDILNELLLLDIEECEECSVVVRRAKARLLLGKE